MNKESLQNVILQWFIRELVSSWLGFPGGSVAKKYIYIYIFCLPMQKMQVQPLGLEYPLE